MSGVAAERARAAGETVGDLVERARVLVCGGAGGVGKTTTAAALGLEGARRGRKVCVVTIDPARRLGDALGVRAAAGELVRVEEAGPGELWALMLDAKGNFDELVRRYATSEEQAESILRNRLYRNLSSSLSGTQEYMASEKLYELTEQHAFDLVVVDTPPARHAVDFLEAPARLQRLLENRIFRLLVLPTTTYLRAVSIGLRAFLRSVSSVVGTEVVDDVVAFFETFEGMEDGFRRRAARVEALLREPSTRFVLVTTPQAEAAAEAAWLAAELARAGFGIGATVVNRAQPRFLPPTLAAPEPESLDANWRPLIENLLELEALASYEAGTLEALRAVSGTRCEVPLLPADVHDLDGLAMLSDYLSGRRRPNELS